jgi:hypothetical protein
MIKRTITETICEYDKEGKLIKKTVTETNEEEDNTTLTYPSYPTLTNPCNDDWHRNQPYVTWCNGTNDTSSNLTTTN